MIDRLFHAAFIEAIGLKVPERYNTGIVCCRCGRPLVSYYAEERLYVVSCKFCGLALLVRANSHESAALRIGEHRKEDENNDRVQ